MNVSFTPGPWQVDGLQTGRPVILSGTGINYQEIAYVFLLQIGGIEVGKTNARLIAQAPVLFDLVSRLADLPLYYTDIDPEIMELCQLAKETLEAIEQP